jgi:NADPH:quinone reductase-like Zn-dependent oxidoreductase
MPDLDYQRSTRKPAARPNTAARAAAPSRRSVLRVAAGAGAAGIAATALSGAAGSAAAQASAATDSRAARLPPDEAAGTDPLVLHVRDAAAGEIDVFRGTTQTRLHDRALAARIVRASR